LAYAYDKDGRITQLTRNNGTKDNYGYDNVNRLISEARTTGTAATYSIGYTYDKNGNRTSLTATGQHMQPAESVSYTYAGNKLASLTKAGVAQTISHTGNAELNFGTYLPTYDNGGRRKVDRASAGYYYMNYNHKNERSFRDYVVSGAVTVMTQFIYDEQSHLIGEYDKNGVQVEYVWLGDTPIAAIYGSGAATKIYYIISDAQNTPRRLVDSTNHAVVWAWDSTAFGLGNPTGSITFNLRFPGQYYDVGTNQFYNHNRFYNPELGRYMEADPIGLEGGLNPYAYAGSNPIMNSDSKGLKLEPMNFDQMMRFDLSQLDNPLLNTRMWDLQLKNINLIGNSRGLTDGEIKMSQPVFGNKIDYSQPRVFNRPWLNNPLQSRAMAPDGNIYYPKDKYREDFSTQKLGERATFIHNMSHLMNKSCSFS